MNIKHLLIHPNEDFRAILKAKVYENNWSTKEKKNAYVRNRFRYRTEKRWKCSQKT